MTIQVAVIGGGIRGEMYTRGIVQSPRAKHAGVVELVPDRRNALSSRYGIATWTSLDHLMKEGAFDAAVVATPDFAHKEQVLALAKRGTPLLVEKPFATDFDTAAEMARSLVDHGTPVMIAFENRWSPVFQALKQRIGAGDLGSPLFSRAFLNDTSYVPRQMLSWSARSGPGWFLLPHVIDVLRWLTNSDVVSVFAQGVQRHLLAAGIQTLDGLQTMLRWDNEHTSMVETQWVMPETSPYVFDFGVSLTGTRGAVSARLQPQMAEVASERYEWPGTLLQEIDGQLRGFPLWMLDHFIDRVGTGQAFSISLRDALVNTAVVDAVHRSASSHNKVEMAPYMAIIDSLTPTEV